MTSEARLFDKYHMLMFVLSDTSARIFLFFHPTIFFSLTTAAVAVSQPVLCWKQQAQSSSSKNTLIRVDYEYDRRHRRDRRRQYDRLRTTQSRSNSALQVCGRPNLPQAVVVVPGSSWWCTPARPQAPQPRS